MLNKRMIVEGDGFTCPNKVNLKRGDRVRALVEEAHSSDITRRKSLRKGKKTGVVRYKSVPEKIGIVQEVTVNPFTKVVMVHISYGDCLIKLNFEKVVKIVDTGQ